MSVIRTRFMRNKVTRWRKSDYDSNDAYNQTFSTASVTFSCAYINGGSLQKDQNGAEFMPMSTFYMKENDIQIGDLVLRGLHIGDSNIDKAETVRKIVTKTTLRGTADMTVYTG